MDIELLPGADLVTRGIDDLRDGKQTMEALLVSIGYPRLKSLGFDVADPIPDAETKLYLLLRTSFGDAAHSRYNSLVRRLVSFERAAGRGR